MKTKILLPLAIVVAIAALIYGYVQMSKERAQAAQGEQAITAESKVERGTNGESFIMLDLNTQKLIGLQTATVAAATQAPEIKTYGRALDPAPLVGLLSDMTSTRAALEPSSKEYQRLKALFDQGQNTSAKALETAEAALKRDQIVLQAAEARLVAAWGKSVAAEPDLPAFVLSLAGLESVLVRLDLPSGEAVTDTPTGARVVLPGTAQPVEARFLGRTTTTDPQVQGEGFLFVITNAPPRLTPGLVITGYLQLPGQPRQGAVVPDDAVVRSAERTWVYTQTGDTTFARREIVLDHPVAEGWFVTNGVAPGDRLVVIGAQTLLSEERKAQIQIGD